MKVYSGTCCMCDVGIPANEKDMGGNDLLVGDIEYLLRLKIFIDGMNQFRNGEAVDTQEAINKLKGKNMKENKTITEAIERLVQNKGPMGTGYRDWREGVNDAVDAIEDVIGCGVDSINLMGDSESTPWNGEGLPPVGVECEVVFFGLSIKKCIPLAFYESMVWLKLWEDGAWVVQTTIAENLSFRPIRTEREKAVEEMLSHQEYEMTAEEFCGILYDNNYRKQEGKQ